MLFDKHTTVNVKLVCVMTVPACVLSILHGHASSGKRSGAALLRVGVCVRFAFKSLCRPRQSKDSESGRHVITRSPANLLLISERADQTANHTQLCFSLQKWRSGLLWCNAVLTLTQDPEQSASPCSASLPHCNLGV